MRYYKIKLEITDAIEAPNERAALERVVWDWLPSLTDLSDFIEIEQCNKRQYKLEARGIV